MKFKTTLICDNFEVYCRENYLKYYEGINRFSGWVTVILQLITSPTFAVFQTTVFVFQYQNTPPLKVLIYKFASLEICFDQFLMSNSECLWPYEGLS